LTHRGMEEIFENQQRKDRTIWVPRATDPELEAEFLRRLMTAFGATEQALVAAAPVPGSPSAASSGSPARAERAIIQGQGDDQRLTITEGFDQAWRQLSLALDRGGFTVEDRDRSKGQFFVRYVDPETQAKLAEKPGFLSRVFGGAGSVLDQTERFQLSVQRNGEQTYVEVRDAKGASVPVADRPTAGKILALLKNQLN
jgi:outer membrane protein assembly factor BamC